jgi:hypothetical protein
MLKAGFYGIERRRAPHPDVVHEEQRQRTYAKMRAAGMV